MPIVAAVIMGGAALASGGIGALGSSSAASAQAAAQEYQQQQANFKNQWAHEADQRNQMRAFQANLERNAMLEKGANIDRALQEFYLDKTFQNQKGTLSKQTASTNAQFLGTLSSRSIGSSSGTARALLRQNMTSVQANMIALKTNYRQSYKDIENQQNQKLGQRQFQFQEQSVFLPVSGGIADTSSTALVTGLIQAGISGAAAGYGAYRKYGNPTGGGTAAGAAMNGNGNLGYINP